MKTETKTKKGTQSTFQKRINGHSIEFGIPLAASYPIPPRIATISHLHPKAYYIASTKLRTLRVSGFSTGTVDAARGVLGSVRITTNSRQILRYYCTYLYKQGKQVKIHVVQDRTVTEQSSESNLVQSTHSFIRGCTLHTAEGWNRKGQGWKEKSCESTTWRERRSYVWGSAWLARNFQPYACALTERLGKNGPCPKEECSIFEVTSLGLRLGTVQYSTVQYSTRRTKAVVAISASMPQFLSASSVTRYVCDCVT